MQSLALAALARIREISAASLPAGRIRIDVQLATTVTSVRRPAHGAIQLTASMVGAEAPRAVVECEHVVIAVPPRLAARSIEFQPPLPPQLRAAMVAQNTWMAATAKIAFRFDRAWWRRAGNGSSGGIQQQLATNINRARFGRTSSVFQLMDACVPASSDDSVHALVAFAMPPAVDSMQASHGIISGHAQLSRLMRAALKSASAGSAQDGADDDSSASAGLPLPPPAVCEWLSAAARDVLGLAASTYGEALPVTDNAAAAGCASAFTLAPAQLLSIEYHSWRHDPLCFNTDGRRAAPHDAYFQHPDDGGDILRRPIAFLDEQTPSAAGQPIAIDAVPRSPRCAIMLLAASETDDRAPGVIEGAVRSGHRAARELLRAAALGAE
jgi:hypothetical protein